MAAQKPGSCPNGLAKTDQPRGRRAPLSGVAKQGETNDVSLKICLFVTKCVFDAMSSHSVLSPLEVNVDVLLE